MNSYSNIYDYTRKWTNPIFYDTRKAVEKYTGIGYEALKREIDRRYGISNEEGDAFIDYILVKHKRDNNDDLTDPTIIGGVSRNLSDRYGLTVNSNDVRGILIKDMIEDSARAGESYPHTILSTSYKTPFVVLPSSVAGLISRDYQYGAKSAGVSLVSSIAPFAAGAYFGQMGVNKLVKSSNVIAASLLNNKVSRYAARFLGGTAVAYGADWLIHKYVDDPLKKELGLENQHASFLETLTGFGLTEFGFSILRKMPIIGAAVLGAQVLGLPKFFSKIGETLKSDYKTLRSMFDASVNKDMYKQFFNIIGDKYKDVKQKSQFAYDIFKDFLVEPEPKFKNASEAFKAYNHKFNNNKSKNGKDLMTSVAAGVVGLGIMGTVFTNGIDDDYEDGVFQSAPVTDEVKSNTSVSTGYLSRELSQILSMQKAQLTADHERFFLNSISNMAELIPNANLEDKDIKNIKKDVIKVMRKFKRVLSVDDYNSLEDDIIQQIKQW